jgi:hypothetical protein
MLPLPEISTIDQHFRAKLRRYPKCGARKDLMYATGAMTLSILTLSKVTHSVATQPLEFLKRS